MQRDAVQCLGAKMVYIYVCKRFKNTMEMVAGKDGKWVDDVLQFYCKHGKMTAKLERAEINPGSVQQSRLSSQFEFQCCNLLNTQKTGPFYLNLHFNFEVFKMGFKW